MKMMHLSCQPIKPIRLISLMNKFKYSSVFFRNTQIIVFQKHNFIFISQGRLLENTLLYFTPPPTINFNTRYAISLSVFCMYVCALYLKQVRFFSVFQEPVSASLGQCSCPPPPDPLTPHENVCVGAVIPGDCRLLCLAFAFVLSSQ